MTKFTPIIAALFLGLASIASAQTITGSIVGVVTDTSGAAIVAADITLTMTQTGARKTTKTGDTGEFTFTALEPGQYAVSVVAKGFKKFERTSMNLTAGERLSAGTMEMQVGAVTDSITVQSEGTVVQTASAEHSGVLTSSQVDNLTIKGRNVMSLLQLLPGVVETNNPDGPDRNFGIGLNVNGNRRNATGVSLDGVQTADAGTGWIATANISMDAVAEVKVLLNNFQAEYGRIRGAGVLMVGKSGSRDFHGSFSYFKRHEQFNANNFFSNRSSIPRPRYRYNTYSYNINGPIMIPKLFNRNREKLFFSWTQEYWPQTSGWGPNTYTVPTELERQGNFSQSIDQSGKAIVVKDPLTGVAFPGMVIPSSRMDVSGASLFKLLPLPNFTDRNISKGGYNYLVQGSFDKPQMMNTLKVDYHITQNDIASLTWSRHSDVQTGTNGLATPNAGWDLENRTFATRGNIMSGRYQKIFTPTLINELVFGYNWRFENEVIPDSVLKTMTMANIGFTAPQPYPTSNPGLYLPNVTFGGGPTPSPIGLTYTNVGLQANIPTYNITDNITKIRGNHTFKAGFFFNRGNYINQPTNDRGALSFSVDVNNPNDTGNTWANTYMGAFASYSQRNKILVTDGIYKAYEWFVQDSWKVNRRLSLEIGVRFAVSPPGYSAFEEGMFDPRAFNPSKAVKLIQPTMVNGKRVGIDPTTQKIYPAVNIGAIAPNSGDLANGITLASQTQQGIIDGPGLIYGPRFGFAWDVFGNGKTAIRGGYGAFQSTGANGEGKAGSQTIVPLTFTARLVYGTLAGLSTSASGLLYPSGATAYRQSGYKYPVSNQISFNVQQNLGWGTVLEVGYVGNMSSHLTWTFDNDALPVGTNFDPKNIDPTTGRAYPTTFLRKYTGFDGVNYLNYGSSSNYHSMQTTVNRRFARGLQLGGSWTWSKWLGTAEFDGNGVSPFLPARVYNYGLAGPDRTHNLRVNFLYEIPKSPWKDFASKWVLNGWSVSGITAFISGSPFNPGVGTTDSRDITGTSSQGPRLNVIGPGNLPKSERTFDRYFNTAAFAVPAVGTLGNGGRNYLRGPGTANWDLALYKDFPIKEPFKLQLRGEGYNAFNHTQWAGVNSSTNFNPAGVQTNALFGQVNSARTPRILQVALRFVF